MVDVLSNERVRLNREIGVHLGHIQVIDEVDETSVDPARRAVAPTGLFLQRVFENALEGLARRVEVERDIHHRGVLPQVAKVVLNEDRFAGASCPHEHDWASLGHEEVKEVADSSGLGGGDKSGLEVENTALSMRSNAAHTA